MPERIYFCYGSRFYDPVHDSWGDFAGMPTVRDGMAVAVLNDKLYAIGGDQITLKSIISYDYKLIYKATVEEYTPYGYGTVPPAVSAISLENNKTYVDTAVDLNFTVNKPVAWIGYSLDGQDNVTIPGNTTVNELANGAHNLTMYAIDEFGNTAASETIHFNIDVPEPFPTVPIAASIASATVISIALLYLKKRRR